MDIELLPGEEFKELVKGYYISNMGRVFSIKRNKFLKPNINSSGYQRATVYIKGKRKHVFIHIKVVEFFGDYTGRRIPKGIKTLHEANLEIDHINRDKSNCSIYNLELVSVLENRQRWRNVNKYDEADDELGF